MSQQSQRIECLDGLRGLAALWVLVGHATLLTGFRVPILSRPELGVDLFMLLSGFLMVFHYQLRREREPWAAPATWRRFWARRFFRIAPLYYVALAAAVILGPMLFADRSILGTFVPGQAQPASRYTDASLANVLMHASFLFGLHPDFAYRTALPDWSIGLEMQFYAAFPFLMLVIARLGWVRGVVLLGIAGGLIGFAFDAFKVFPMPSLLVLKLHIFLAGMLAAAAIDAGRNRVIVLALLATALAVIPVGGPQDLKHWAFRAALTLGVFGLIHVHHLPKLARRPIEALSATLGRGGLHWLGELSYGAYLIHLLVLIPVAAGAFLALGDDQPRVLIFAAALIPTLIVTYALAWAAHFAIERPGQALGRAALAPRPIERTA